MRIAYLTQVGPSPTHTDTLLPERMTDALAKRGHEILIIAASDREYIHQIRRSNITIVQLRSFKSLLFMGQQPVFLPIPRILQTLHGFRPDIIYMDMTSSMNWIGHVYSFFSHIPTKRTPQSQVRATEQN